jgi:hypothetical protein
MLISIWLANMHLSLARTYELFLVCTATVFFEVVALYVNNSSLNRAFCSFGQNQFSLLRASQQVAFTVMQNIDLTALAKKLSALNQWITT